MDNSVPPDLVPQHIPVIALPHAFWIGSPAEMKTWLNRSPASLGNTDWYFAQGDVAPLSVTPVSLRRGQVRLLPLGNLKLDEMRRRRLAEGEKKSIVYCCSAWDRTLPLAEKKAVIAACLRAFPEHVLYLRPFPEERSRYVPLEEAFRATGRFRIDSGRSTLRHLPSAAAVLCDHTSTVGYMYSLATGRPAVILTEGHTHFWYDGVAGFLMARSADEAVAGLRSAMSVVDELPELTALRASLVYRPGEARNLFYRYLAQILSGSLPEEALVQPCEYIGDLRLDSAEAELRFFLEVLRADRADCYGGGLLTRRFADFAKLMNFYAAANLRRLRKQPSMLLLRCGEGGGCLMLDTKCCAPFFCPAPPEAYLPETREFVRRNEALRLAAEPEEGDARILLPDADKALFCATLADCLERVHGGRSAAEAGRAGSPITPPGEVS